MRIGDREVLIGIGIVFLGFFFLLFKLTGLRFIIGFMLIFILPIYLILDLFRLGALEKIAYAFFLSIGIIPSMVYYLGIFIRFRIAIIVVFITLLVAGFALRKYCKLKFNKRFSPY